VDQGVFCLAWRRKGKGKKPDVRQREKKSVASSSCFCGGSGGEQARGVSPAADETEGRI